MSDLLAEASAIAELRDLDRLGLFLDDLTRWRPEHTNACQHCMDELGALTTRLIVRHQLDPVWLLRQLVKLMAGDFRGELPACEICISRMWCFAHGGQNLGSAYSPNNGNVV